MLSKNDLMFLCVVILLYSVVLRYFGKKLFYKFSLIDAAYVLGYNLILLSRLDTELIYERNKNEKKCVLCINRCMKFKESHEKL